MLLLHEMVPLTSGFRVNMGQAALIPVIIVKDIYLLNFVTKCMINM